MLSWKTERRGEKISSMPRERVLHDGKGSLQDARNVENVLGE